MTVNQIYSEMNTIANNLGWTGFNVVDRSSFVAFASQVLSSAVNKDLVFGQMIDRIGKTIFAIDNYEGGHGRNITVDAFTWGSVLQKISAKHKEATEASEWEVSTPENPYTVTSNTEIVQKLFVQALPTFSYTEVIHDFQLESAFVSPEAMGSFYGMLYTLMYNEYTRAKEGMEVEAVNALIVKTYNDTTNANYSRRVRKVVTEYNALHSGDEVTASSALEDANFLKWLRKELMKATDNLTTLSRLYNDGTVDRVTDKNELHFDLLNDVAYNYDSFYSDRFNADFLKIPRYNSVVNFGTAIEPSSIIISQTTSEGSTTTVKISNVIGAMYDSDSVVATMDRERNITKYDEWNARTLVKLSADRRYIADESENCIVWVLE